MLKPEHEYLDPKSDFIIIGQVRKPHGIRGGLRVEPLTQNSDRYKLLQKVFLHSDAGTRKEFEIDSVQIGNKCVLLNLVGIHNRDDAEKWRGAWVEITRDQSEPLPAGSYYYYEILGLRVMDSDGKPIGIVSEIHDYPANDVYVVKNGEKEYLIPAVPAIVKEINVEQGIIIIDVVEGLLD